MSTDPSLVEDIRAASRSMVRELGFMQSTLAASGHSASAVHTLLEIDARGAMTAAQLAPFLGLDKSSISRMLAKLIEAGELEEAVAGDDARVKQLSLTRAGKRKVDQIHAYGRMQVNTAMARLNPSQRQAVAQGLGAYAQALQACRENDEAFRPGASNPITIHAGYQPGMIGRITEMHAAFYARHAGFGQFFESQVATGVAEFAGRLNQTGNHVWLALLNDRIVGSVAIDGQDLATTTRTCAGSSWTTAVAAAAWAASCWPRPWPTATGSASPPPGSGPSRDSMRPASCMNRSASSWCARKPESNGVRRSRNSSSSARPRCPNAFSLLSFPGNVPER